IDVEAELGGDDDLALERLERLADDGLVGEGPVDLRGVEEGYTSLRRGADEGDGLRAIDGGAEAEAESHTAEPEGGDVETVRAECAGLHRAGNEGMRNCITMIAPPRDGQGSNGKTRRQSFFMLTTSHPFLVATSISSLLKVPTFVSGV